jgi:hypothetical protein
MVAWKNLARLSDAELARRDIAEVNLACAAGLPGAESLDSGDCLRKLNRWAMLVQRQTDRFYRRFLARPEEFNHSRGYFRVLVMVTVLQRDLGAVYNRDTTVLPDEKFFSRPELLFLHGPLNGPNGTCSSLPPVYIAVGRRLGYPLKLVSSYNHFFARWDDDEGERFNVECAATGLICHPDEYYRDWPIHLSDDEHRRRGHFQSMTPRRELAEFLANRGVCWYENGRIGNAAEAYIHAADLDPGTEARIGCLDHVLANWRRALRCRLPPCKHLPRTVVEVAPRRFKNLPLDTEMTFFNLRAREWLIENADFDSRWWRSLRANPTVKPAGLPSAIECRYHGASDEAPDIQFLDGSPGMAPPRATRDPVFRAISQNF